MEWSSREQCRKERKGKRVGRGLKDILGTQTIFFSMHFYNFGKKTKTRQNSNRATPHHIRFSVTLTVGGFWHNLFPQFGRITLQWPNPKSVNIIKMYFQSKCSTVIVVNLITLGLHG
jgi:hypothetical protein